MSFLASVPGAKFIAQSAVSLLYFSSTPSQASHVLQGKTLNRLEQKSEALHNAFMPVTVHDSDTNYDAPQSKGAKIIEQFREQVCSLFDV
jgi:hypothetical protein